ncbi:MAG: hypothetical protein WC861_05695 [Candidatus Micrarchaeia archaeon]
MQPSSAADQASPHLYRPRPALAILGALVKSKVEYLYRNSHRYGFEPRPDAPISGYIISNTLFLSTSPSKHIEFGLGRGTAPRVALGALPENYGHDVDAHVRISADKPVQGGAIPLAPVFQQIRAGNRLAARMGEVRQKAGCETIGMSCSLPVSREFPREAALLSMDMVQYRI